MLDQLLQQFSPTAKNTQIIRLLDVFVFGPLIIQAAAAQRNKTFTTALIAIGLGTIVYNAVNYLRIAQTDQSSN